MSIKKSDTDKSSLENEKQPSCLGAVMQRLIIHSIIVLACYYICHVLLRDDGWLDIVYAICWSGNAFWLSDYTKWVANVANVEALAMLPNRKLN